MGFRFRRTIRIARGVRINISKSGMSTSLGKPDSTINLNKRGVRTTVGLPGSGMGYQQNERWGSPNGGKLPWLIIATVFFVGLAALHH